MLIMKGSEMILKTLKDHKINTSFGICGGSVIPLFDAVYDDDEFRNILVRHEQAAAHAADGYARASGNIGVAIATSGPGATNLVTGLGTAYYDSSPILAFGGQVSLDLLGKDAFQESDMMGITLPITKHNFQIKTADDVNSTIRKAMKIATSRRQGPVYVELPKECQVGEITRPISKTINVLNCEPILRANKEQIKKIADYLLKADNPVFIVGGGVISSNASRQVNQLIEMLNIPAVTTLMGKGAIPENHALCLGMLGMHGRKSANYAIMNADLIIVFGCRFSDRITGKTSEFARDAKIIHIDIDPSEINKNINIDMSIIGDLKLVLDDILSVLKVKLKSPKETEWSKKMKKIKQICSCDTDINKIPIDPRKVIKEINNIIKDTDIITTGVGQHQMYAAHFLERNTTRTFISSGGFGTMGSGFPFAIGAKIAKPNVEVFDIDGDGSFLMNSQELATAKEESIKITPIIFNNNYLGMVRQWLEIFYDKRYSQVNLGKTTNFVKMAEAYGLEGIFVERPSEIKDALLQAIKNNETTLVNIAIEPESNILPMLPPMGELKDAFGGCMEKAGYEIFEGLI